jgi:phosphoribosylamine-glycine ligase
MRVLLISKEGDGLGVAQRLALEGNDVDVYIAEERFAKAGQGLVNRVLDWVRSSRDADLILADCVGLGRYEDALRKLGTPFIGCSEVLDKIELDRWQGMEMFRRAGITIPPTYRFSSTREALALPSEHGWEPGWVIKPDGNVSTAKTMVVREQNQWEQCVGALQPGSTGIVQKIVEGVEVSTEGWFNGSRFVQYNHTWEDKRFLVGDLGQNTGCMGNIVLACGADKLVRGTVQRMQPFLRLLDYRGPFDINCIVNADGAFALEATSRMGYDAVEALLEGLDEPATLFLGDIAGGVNREPSVTEQTMVAVRLSIPPWPMRKPDRDDKPSLVTGIDKSTLPHLFLTDLYCEDGVYYTAGGDGVLLKATAIGRPDNHKTDKSGRPYNTDYTWEARRRVYRLLGAINVHNKQYRTDIGTRVNEDIAKLKEWGWLTV